MRITIPIIHARHCPTCLHHSAPAICFYRSGLSQVCQAWRTSAHRSLVSLHWLCAAERIEYSSAVPLLTKLLVLLSTSFRHLADVPSRRRLRSSSTIALIVRLGDVHSVL